LPKQLGYGGALLLQLAVFAALAALLLRARPSAATTTPTTSAEPATPAVVLRRIFRAPWPAVVGGAAIGVLGTFALFRGAPLGVTAELARLARAAGNALHLLPSRLEGLDEIAGCRPTDDPHVVSDRGIFVLALVTGALVASLAAGEFRWRVARPRALALALLGGVLLGFGAFVASGCTVGALLSGVTAFSLHGWLFGGGLFAGAFAGVAVLRRVAPPSAPLLDLCGESCGMPELRLAALLDRPGRPDRFTVVADDPNALEPLLAVAARRGFTGSVAPADGRGVKVEFRAGPRVP
ncbi:MAG TPA: YeeE/YedE thiosulfate transporter family protein, partial [Planctomycetota bacterium]|nr:YeeE/YedE thiosulfate transporter family protein [Planctomycetota bacterium]